MQHNEHGRSGQAADAAVRNALGRPRLSRRELAKIAIAGGGAGAATLAGLPGAIRSSAAQGSPQTFTIATNRSPSDLDPHSAYDAGSGILMPGPFESLIRLQPGSRESYEPVLAESWEANADQSVWTFRLHEGIRFHDGIPCDAEAVRASFERLLTLGLPPSTILGRFIQDPSQVTAPDAATVVFDLGRPQPLFEAAMASPYGTAVVNVAALKAHEVDGDWGHAWAQTNADGIGTGPFRIASFDQLEGVELVRFDDYWRGWTGEHVDTIFVRIVAEAETRRSLVEQGEADLALTLPPRVIGSLESNPLLRVDSSFNLSVVFLVLNSTGPLETPEARQAMCWAFPYDDVITGVYAGRAKRAVGPVAELCRGFDPQTFTYTTDLERARALLAQANVADGTAISMIVPEGNPLARETAELYQANLAQIGLQLEISVVDFATFVSIFYGDLSKEERPLVMPNFWSPDYNDGWSHLWPLLSCEAWPAGNVGHYCNERVEELLGQARDATDEASYQDALSGIQQIATRDDPAAVYFAQPEVNAVLRADIEGYTPHPIVSDLMDFYRLYRRQS